MKLGGTKALSPLEFLVHKKVGRGSAHSRRGEEEKVFQLRRLLLQNQEKEKKKGTSSLVWQRHLLTIETTVLSKIITCCCTWPACQRFPPPARALSKSKAGRGRQRIPSATWQIKKGNSAHIWETLYDEKKSYFAERHHRRRRFPLAARSQHCIGGDVRYQCQAVVVLLGRPIGISFSSFAPGRQFCKKKKETSKQK